VAVCVRDRHRQLLMPGFASRVRWLKNGARISDLMPFAIPLVDRTVEHSTVEPLPLQWDPGSRTTGQALVREADLVAEQPGAGLTAGRHVGTRRGRLAILANGWFNIPSDTGLVQGIHHRPCRRIQRADGYGHGGHPAQKGESGAPPRPDGRGLRAATI